MHPYIKRRNESFYRAEGQGTTALATKREGDIVDVFGPLGNGFPIEETKAGETAILIRGWNRSPSTYELSKQLTAKGVKCVHILGFQSKTSSFTRKHSHSVKRIL